MLIGLCRIELRKIIMETNFSCLNTVEIESSLKVNEGSQSEGIVVTPLELFSIL